DILAKGKFSIIIKYRYPQNFPLSDFCRKLRYFAREYQSLLRKNILAKGKFFLILKYRYSDNLLLSDFCRKFIDFV
ncbi:hypothetical protein, partial [Okeania sp.]|uniref:hypothetical protein n=1 Tax=Okeania sp. TaxID=3100323 RepID=UPI002B4B7F18